MVVPLSPLHRAREGGHPVTTSGRDTRDGRSVPDRPAAIGKTRFSLSPDDDDGVCGAMRYLHRTVTLSATAPCAITHLRNSSKSILPPLRISPTRLPESLLFSCNAAASGAAPAPSERLWVSVQ